MLNDIIEVEPRGDYRLWRRFQDGTEGEVDLGPDLDFRGVFAPLRDPSYFARVRLNREIGTICWPNGADCDPLVLYSLVTGRAIDGLLDESRRARACTHSAAWIRRLSGDEQIDYVQSLWDRIAASPDRVPVPEWHHQVLAERLKDYEANPDAGESWDDVRKRLRKKLRQS